MIIAAIILPLLGILFFHYGPLFQDRAKLFRHQWPLSLATFALGALSVFAAAMHYGVGAKESLNPVFFVWTFAAFIVAVRFLSKVFNSRPGGGNASA